jgi:glycosyltransferase involved in cell wall biosynthesis
MGNYADLNIIKAGCPWHQQPCQTAAIKHARPMRMEENPITFSIIMPSFNSQDTIERAIKSFMDQDFESKELIIVDGLSQDQTRSVVENFKAGNIRFIGEADDGIYDAINKGISISSGSIVGVLHSDDYYADGGVLSRVAEKMRCNRLDAVYADVEFFDRKSKKIIRRYSSRIFSSKMLKYGLMPAHPTLFLRRHVFKSYGLYRVDLRISSDFEYVARIFKDQKIQYDYIEDVLVKMQLGGVSTSGLRATLLLNEEILIACRSNGIRTSRLHMIRRYFYRFQELTVFKKIFGPWRSKTT